ncbi:hypothetical protein RJ55_08448 [Drechmeria coniospora]|nr:hypothetical protein RJ55_08448 [Drechmeria coniospora]
MPRPQGSSSSAHRDLTGASQRPESSREGAWCSVQTGPPDPFEQQVGIEPGSWTEENPTVNAPFRRLPARTPPPSIVGLYVEDGTGGRRTHTLATLPRPVWPEQLSSRSIDRKAVAAFFVVAPHPCLRLQRVIDHPTDLLALNCSHELHAVLRLHISAISTVALYSNLVHCSVGDVNSFIRPITGRVLSLRRQWLS